VEIINKREPPTGTIRRWGAKGKPPDPVWVGGRGKNALYQDSKEISVDLGADTNIGQKEKKPKASTRCTSKRKEV